MSKKGCIRTDNMSGTTLGKNLVSVEYQVSNAATEIENGRVVVIGALKSGSREVRIATTPVAGSPLSSIAIIASEEVLKDKPFNNNYDFTNEAGAIARAYRLVSKDVFSLTAEAFDCAEDVTAAVGKIVELQADTKLHVVTTLTSNSTQVGSIIAVENGWYVIEVA